MSLGSQIRFLILSTKRSGNGVLEVLMAPMEESFPWSRPRVLDIEDYKKLTLEELANGIYQVDTAGWAEPWIC